MRVSIPRRYAKNKLYGSQRAYVRTVSIPRRYAKNAMSSVRIGPGDGVVSIPRRYAKNVLYYRHGSDHPLVSIPRRYAKNRSDLEDYLEKLREFQSLVGTLKTAAGTSSRPPRCRFNPS